ncbi:unnamed protein product [Thelazia callipaeda]|uniref:Zinc finger CCCH domain-containing protein 14 n=1 Tax=Thelazia callipaeda TaxID=103827 RepID=A0A0N5CP09_THECL|nr:unnamed protein product [Thelazia callipaeda]
MTGGNAEVSKKIRAAIKAKLEELGVYVDEELPDYIMVMIANKKEKVQMKEDLLLFLGKNAEKFVDWLFEIFERLQSATAMDTVQDINDNKRRDNESSQKKESESSNKRQKDKVVEKKKKRDSSDHSKNILKEQEKKDKGRQRGAKEANKKEGGEKHISVAKVVKSKPSRKTKSPPALLEKTYRHKRSESMERRATAHSGIRRESEKIGRKSAHVKSKTENELEEETKSKAGNTRKRNDDKDSRVRRNDSKASNDPAHSASHQRKRKTSSRSPSIEKDVGNSVLAGDSVCDSRTKKVQSSAVVKLLPEPSVKSVSSQVVVKRKLPEKEITTKQSRGVKSLFLKAIKEAGETTRTASHIAGYGGGVAVKNDKDFVDHGKKQNDSVVLDEEESIEIDVYDDIGDALVVMPDETSGGDSSNRSVVQAVDDCNSSEPEVERKRFRAHGPSSAEEPKFYITLKGDAITGLAKQLTKIGEGSVEIVNKKVKTRKRLNETNPILAHLNIAPKQAKREPTHDRTVVSSMEHNTCLISPSNEVSINTVDESKPVPTWDLQIQLPEDDTSDDNEDDGDDEAQIDAVLASAQTVGQNFDEVQSASNLSSSLFHPKAPPPQLFYSTPRQNMYALNRQVSKLTSVLSAGTEKIMERCKFWPNCSLQSCLYIHPSKPCSNFPKCSFGDRCIYIHPQCKFDQMCLNPNCCYAHTKKTTANVTAAVAVSNDATTAQASLNPLPILPLSSVLKVPCKYGGKCANSSCSFKHPKLCRFGDHCKNRACYFWHPKASAIAVLGMTGEKYRWKAPNLVST